MDRNVSSLADHSTPISLYNPFALLALPDVQEHAATHIPATDAHAVKPILKKDVSALCSAAYGAGLVKIKKAGQKPKNSVKWQISERTTEQASQLNTHPPVCDDSAHNHDVVDIDPSSVQVLLDFEGKSQSQDTMFQKAVSTVGHGIDVVTNILQDLYDEIFPSLVQSQDTPSCTSVEYVCDGLVQQHDSACLGNTSVDTVNQQHVDKLVISSQVPDGHVSRESESLPAELLLASQRTLDSEKASISLDVAQVQLQLVEDEDCVAVKLHIYSGISHMILHADGSVGYGLPNCPPCSKIGLVRKKEKKPYFLPRDDMIINPAMLQQIKEQIADYDGCNGHVMPPWAAWTDAFSHFTGRDAQCDRYFSVLNNAFTQDWTNTNIYAFPPMYDDLLHKVLHYHCVQQNKAKQKGAAFRGVYIVPYRPHAAFWKYVGNFQLLQYYPAGTLLYSVPNRKGILSKPIASPQTMCVLYDPGYTEANIQGAFFHALEKCASAFDDIACLDLGECYVPEFASFEWSKVNTTNDEGKDLCELDIPPKPNIVLAMPLCYSKDEYIEVQPSVACNVRHVPKKDTKLGLFETLLQEINASCAEPTELPGQYSYHIPFDTETSKFIRSMQSSGSLQNILEQNDPDWEQVDKSLMEFIKLNQSKNNESNEKDAEVDSFNPEMFSKTWVEGGLLPINQTPSLCNISEGQTINSSSLCLVIKTKIAGHINNTSLIDEGAEVSVLNIDWYEHQGIDWRTKFNISEDTQPGIILMADQSPVETYGTANVHVELSETDGKKFTHSMHFMRLGKHNYAQILGFDWKLKFHTRTSLPEYTIEARKLGCIINAYPLPVRLYQMKFGGTPVDNAPTCEEVTPHQLAKDIKLLSARLRRMHVYIAPPAFVRQIIVRPSKEDDASAKVTTSKPERWAVDSSLEERASLLRKRIEVLREQYVDVLDSESKGLNVKMPHAHVIEVRETEAPYSQKIKRHSPLEMELIGKYITEMVEAGRIRPSESPWGANVLFVPKPDGSYRCCVDYRELNKKMRHDTYPLPRIDVHLDMAQGVFWTKMDLLKGFYQLPMHKDSVKYTAFNTLLGKYEFLVMPMGLQNAPGSFMRAMNTIFDGLLWDPNLRQQYGVLVYLDDILIFSQTEDEHIHILQQVLDRLRKHGLHCRFDKCTFAATEVEYLGFKLSHMGVRMDPKKVEIVKQWPDTPKDKTDIRAFLGLVNYLKRFCKNLSNYTAILSDFCAEKSRDDWTDAHRAAMQSIKDLICSDEVLACPKLDPTTGNYYPFTVITDASEIAIGAI